MDAALVCAYAAAEVFAAPVLEGNVSTNDVVVGVGREDAPWST